MGVSHLGGLLGNKQIVPHGTRSHKLVFVSVTTSLCDLCSV